MAAPWPAVSHSGHLRLLCYLLQTCPAPRSLQLKLLLCWRCALYAASDPTVPARLPTPNTSRVSIGPADLFRDCGIGTSNLTIQLPNLIAGASRLVESFRSHAASIPAAEDPEFRILWLGGLRVQTYAMDRPMASVLKSWKLRLESLGTSWLRNTGGPTPYWPCRDRVRQIAHTSLLSKVRWFHRHSSSGVLARAIDAMPCCAASAAVVPPSCYSTNRGYNGALTFEYQVLRAALGDTALRDYQPHSGHRLQLSRQSGGRLHALHTILSLAVDECRLNSSIWGPVQFG